jgi:hypothetical protein
MRRTGAGWRHQEVRRQSWPSDGCAVGSAAPKRCGCGFACSNEQPTPNAPCGFYCGRGFSPSHKRPRASRACGNGVDARWNSGSYSVPRATVSAREPERPPVTSVSRIAPSRQSDSPVVCANANGGLTRIGRPIVCANVNGRLTPAGRPIACANANGRPCGQPLCVQRCRARIAPEGITSARNAYGTCRRDRWCP